MKPLSEDTTLTVLAVDTATEACSASLLKDGSVTERYQIAPQKHNTLIFEMCHSIFDQAQITFDNLDALVFGRGPGAFTGVRIAASFAQAIAYAKSMPLVPISNLQTVAQSTADKHNTDAVCVAMDARMNEVYSACYQRDPQGIMQAITEETVTAAHDIQIPDDFHCIGAGTGWRCANDALSAKLGERLQACDPDALPDATTMLKIATPLIQTKSFTPANQAFPQYLRNPIAKPKPAP